MNNSKLFEKVESLQNLLIFRATGGESHGAQYKMLRIELMNDSLLRDKLLVFLRLVSI